MIAMSYLHPYLHFEQRTRWALLDYLFYLVHEHRLLESQLGIDLTYGSVPSHLNLKFGTWVLLCPLAEPFDGSEDIIGGFDPFVGLGIFIVDVDEGSDIPFQFGH